MRYLILLFLFVHCEGSTVWREKHGLIKSFDIVYDITSLRVDDDAEYHVTGVSRRDGSVRSYNDLYYQGYTNDELKIKYNGTSKAIMVIGFDDSCCGEGNFSKTGPIVINLPVGYKIETFED